uniref:Putative ovule protein n=1 Tax=Solanum chacoense TaxID=4108 RepID=A0A0V0ICA6_SOLCH
MGSHVIDVRTQNKWTTLNSPAYFVCNILTTTLKKLPPTNYSSWSVDLQAHFYYFSISFIVYHTFLNLPFDPGIPDTLLFYGADKTLVTTGHFLSTYILIAALWGEEVCGLGLNHVSTAAILVKHFSSALEVFLASNPVILVRHMWIKRRDSLLEDIGPNSADIIELEKARQWNGHKLIPPENFKSLSVMSVVRSILPIIFNERYRDKSYYEGDKYIDMTTKLCQENALEVFKFDPAT